MDVTGAAVGLVVVFIVVVDEGVIVLVFGVEVGLVVGVEGVTVVVLGVVGDGLVVVVTVVVLGVVGDKVVELGAWVVGGIPVGPTGTSDEKRYSLNRHSKLEKIWNITKNGDNYYYLFIYRD